MYGLDEAKENKKRVGGQQIGITMQMKTQNESDTKIFSHDVRYNRINSSFEMDQGDVKRQEKILDSVIQMTTMTMLGIAYYNVILKTDIDDKDIIVEEDIDHGGILAMVSLQKLEIPNDNGCQLHMHVRCKIVSEKERGTDIPLANGFASIEMDIDIKTPQDKYLLYLEAKKDKGVVESFIEKCLSATTMQNFTKKARTSYIEGYLDKNGKYPMRALTGEEQLKVGNNTSI